MCDPSECACAKGHWVHMPGPARAHLQESSPVLEHLVSPEGTVSLTSQNMPGALFWAPQGPPCSSFKPGHWWGVERGFQNFPNTVAPGLGDHPLASSVELCVTVCWCWRDEGLCPQHLEPGISLSRWAKGNLCQCLKEAQDVGTNSPGDCLCLEVATEKGVPPGF